VAGFDFANRDRARCAMMHAMTRLAVFTMILAACGGGGGSGGVAPDQIASEVAKVTCTRLFECCTTPELMQEALGAKTEAECESIFAGFGTIVFNVIKDSIAAGRVKYDGDALGTCLDVVAGATCSEFSKQRRNDYTSASSGCKDPFDGQVAANGACANDVDCVSNYCSGDSVDFNGNVTMGTCKPAPTAGNPCDNGDCAENAWCNAGMCAAPKADGMPCSLDDECASDSCTGTPSQCASSAVCDGT
jgi:hypothetical protein